MGTQMKSVVLFAALALALYCTCSEAASSSSSTGSSSAATTKGKCTTYGGGHKGATASCTMCINMATTSDGATTVAQKCDTGAGGNKYCNKYGIGSGKCKKSTQTSGGKTVKMTIYCSDIAGGVKPSGVTCTTYSGASAMTTVSLVSVVT